MPEPRPLTDDERFEQWYSAHYASQSSDIKRIAHDGWRGALSQVFRVADEAARTAADLDDAQQRIATLTTERDEVRTENERLSGAQNAIDDLHRLLDLEPSDTPSERAFMVRCAVENLKAVRKIDDKFHVSGSQIIKTSSGEALPEDEPLWLTRGRDRLIVPTIEHYRKLSVADGCNDYHLETADALLAKFVAYASDPSRMKQPGITRGAPWTPEPAVDKSGWCGSCRAGKHMNAHIDGQPCHVRRIVGERCMCGWPKPEPIGTPEPADNITPRVAWQYEMRDEQEASEVEALLRDTKESK